MAGDGHTTRERLLAAAFYGVSSFLIMFVNKAVLTVYGFPASNFLALAQFGGTVVSLAVLKSMGTISYPDLSVETLWTVFPLPLLFMMNTLTGLGGTKKISLPMFTVLRRMTMLFTMIAEYWLLGTRHSPMIALCVAVMIGGALVAAVDDLAFEPVGYAFILANDFFTAANAVYLKRKLDAKTLGRWGLMFYNSLVSVPLLFIFTVVAQPGSFGEVMAYKGWGDPSFVFLFILSSLMGFILNYAIFVCTEVNSPLTTSVVGALKNVLVTFGGMAFGGDYIFSLANFLGINVSMLGSILYARVTYVEKQKQSAAAGKGGGGDRLRGRESGRGDGDKGKGEARGPGNV